MLEEHIYQDNTEMPPFGYMPNDNIYDPTSRDEVYDPTKGIEQKLPSSGVPTEMLCIFEDDPELNNILDDSFRYDPNENGHYKGPGNIHLNYNIFQKKDNSKRERRWGNTHIPLDDEEPNTDRIGPPENPGGLPGPGGR